jgi:hypothetical protein
MRKASIAVLLALLSSLLSAVCAEAEGSGAWAGYMWKSTAFTDVGAHWTVPGVNCPITGHNQGPAAGVSFWVGLGAGGSDPLQQVGINVACDPTTNRPSYEAFWRMHLPGKSNPATNVFAVRPGDAIAAGVEYANGSFTFVISDQTSHQPYTSPPQACNVTVACPRDSAEWIVERAQDGAAPLAQFAPVEFTDAGANGTGASRQLVVFTMVENGQILSSCEAPQRQPPRQKNPEISFPVIPGGAIICTWSASG